MNISEERLKELFKAALEEHKEDFHIKAEIHYKAHQVLEQCLANTEERQQRANFIDEIRKLDEDKVIDDIVFVRTVRTTINDRMAEAGKMGWKTFVNALLFLFGCAIVVLYNHIAELIMDIVKK